MRMFCSTLACLLVLSSTLALPAQSKATRPAGAGDRAQIEALYQAYIKAFKAKDVNAIMANYAPGNQLFVFDAIPPREYPSWDAYKKDWEGLFASMPGPLDVNMSELNISVVGPVAYTRNVQSGYFTRKDGSRLDVAVRVTDVLRKIKGHWLIVQEHVSVPVDLSTGKADLMSKP
jgi:ketosteroid isomerase-like protein